MTKIKMFGGHGNRPGVIAEHAQKAVNKWIDQNGDRIVIASTQTCATVDPNTGYHCVYVTLTYEEAVETTP